jgi:CRISPR system Cascade subunit CasE
VNVPFFTKAALKRDIPVSALRPVLMPVGETARAATAHHLIWTLFGDAPDRTRDFLWREHTPGEFYLLSLRPPVDVHKLFELKTPKPFAPALSVGDRLAFELRVNATVSRGGAPGVRGKPSDIVMDAIHRLPQAERAGARPALMQEAAAAWMARKGEGSGFVPSAVVVTGYATTSLDRPRGASPARIGVLDLQGTVTVTDPAVFVRCVSEGFGRAKAFGCGLMMLRRW